MSLAALIAQGGPRVSAPDIAGGLMEGAQYGRQAGLQRLQAQGAGLSNLADQVKLQQLQQAQADAQLQRDQMNRNTTMGANGPELNRQGYLSGLAQGGAAPMAYAEQGRFGAQDAAAQVAKIDKAQGEIKRRTQLLSGIKSPMQLAAVIPELEKQGVDVSEIRQIPFRTDWQTALDGMIQQGLSHSERMDFMKQSLAEQAAALDWQKADVDLQYKREGAELDQARLAETIRNNKAGAAVDWYRAQNPAATSTAGGKPPTGYRYTANGDLEAIPGGPADAKAQALANQRASGSTDVAASIATLRDAYDRLEAGGGITSTKKGALSNVLAAGSSSTVGQMLGRAAGSKNQSARNDIAMSRPALLGALMKATGMSAKQMDSNAELKLWLATATDPTLDVESNRRALDALERKYMSGATPAGPATPATVTSQAQYDALPAGTEYVDGNGVPHVKRGR